MERFNRPQLAQYLMFSRTMMELDLHRMISSTTNFLDMPSFMMMVQLSLAMISSVSAMELALRTIKSCCSNNCAPKSAASTVVDVYPSPPAISCNKEMNLSSLSTVTTLIPFCKKYSVVFPPPNSSAVRLPCITAGSHLKRLLRNKTQESVSQGTSRSLKRQRSRDGTSARVKFSPAPICFMKPYSRFSAQASPPNLALCEIRWIRYHYREFPLRSGIR